MNKKQKKMLVRILISAAMTNGLNLVPIYGLPRVALFMLAYLIIG